MVKKRRFCRRYKAIGEIIIPPVSVCHHVSTTGHFLSLRGCCTSAKLLIIPLIQSLSSQLVALYIFDAFFAKALMAVGAV
jgi:hypothetical protein